MAETHDTIKGLLAEFRWYSAGMPPSYHVTMSWADFRKMLDRFEAAHRRERGDCAKLRETLEYPKDANDKYIHIGDAVHMLNTNHEGDHEWDDVVLFFEYVGKGGGDDWLVYGEDGAAWACECEVLKQEGGNDGNE